MFTLTITLTGGKLPRLSSEATHAITIDAAVAAAAEVKENFTRLATASGSRSYWHEAAAKTQVESPPGGNTCSITITQRGVRLRWQGGIVRPTGKPSAVTGKPTRSLLIPFADSPLRLRRCTLAELGLPLENLHVITSRSGCPLLVASETLHKKTKLLYLGKLVKSTTHRPRPDVLPTPLQMRAAASAAAKRALISHLS